jgi:hypothetical protein
MFEEKKQGLPDQPSPPFQNRGLFSDHFLQARLPEWKEWKVDAELVPFRESLQSLYNSKKSILPYLNEAQTELEFVQPVLDLLGYANSYIVQAPTKVGQHTNRPDYALFPDVKTKNKAYQKLDQNDYSLCIGIADAKYWERELDFAKSSDRDTFTNQNPSFQIAQYLTGTKQNWGILTNGRLWRLYSSKSHLPLGNYYQVDLVQLLEEAPVEIFKYFYVLFCKQALLQIEGKSLLDRILEGSEEYAVELEADIKERAYDVVELLCRGFAADFTHKQLTDAALKSLYDNSLTLLYRLLFVFYAEARELLPLTTNASYRENYSLRKLTHDIDEIFKKEYELSTSSTQYYHYVSNLFSLINNGDPKLGVPEYNGGLFDPIEHPFLEKQAISDAYLVRAIHQLAQITDKKLRREVAVDYNTLSERHLGSIYEGLLEFKPMIAPHNLVVIKDKGSVKYAPANKHPGKKVAYTKDELYLANDKGERKASGSYYTPEYIVNYIAENTLDPLAKEAHEKVKALKPKVDKAIAKWQKLKEHKQGLEPTAKYDRKIAEESGRLLEPYLSLKVLDLAMGSGHFLARATDFLAEAIATDPDIKSPLELTEESELTYYRRRVVESCIYGVDLNPLAVELAKLTLWLTTMAKSKPLSFINHHLRVGNSLIGAGVADLDEIPKAKRRKKVVDLSRAPVQLGLFQEAFNKKLYDLLQSRALIAQLSTETLEDVHNKQKWEKDFKHNMERFRMLADTWVSTFFGNDVRWDEYNTLIENIQSPDQEWKKFLETEYVQNALNLREHYRFFHWELEFPEVFYDEQGNRKNNAGFDAVIGNPPYDVLERERLGTEAPHAELAKYLESDPVYYPALGGKVNLFRPFLIRDHQLLRDGGLVGKIVPLAIVNDFSCTRTRAHLLNKARLLCLECFPQKDDSRDRVFEDAKLSTCVIVFGKPGPTTHFVMRVYPGKYFIDSPKEACISFKEIKAIDPDVFPIPLLSQAEWDIVTKIHLRLPVCHISQLAMLTRGEMNQTIFAEFITRNPNHQEMIKGVEIGRYSEHWYLSQGEKEWFDEQLYHQKIKNPKTIPDFRIGIQRITGIDEEIRLRAAFFKRRVYFADSTNSIESEDETRLYFLLSLMNSQLFNWRFKLTSTNNNVSTNELDRLPIRRISFITPTKERKQLLEKAKKLYQEYLNNQNWDKILAFVSECLPIKADGMPDTDPEKPHVVHDLLAFLAEEMTRLNKGKQSSIKAFLSWLEKEILKSSVEDQKNKTRIKDFHNNTFEDLLDVLKKNKVVKDPCPSDVRDTIVSEFSSASKALTPLKARIKATDDLIDQIVYRLYGLSDAEIAIVEGQPSHSKPA